MIETPYRWVGVPANRRPRPVTISRKLLPGIEKAPRRACKRGSAFGLPGDIVGTVITGAIGNLFG